MSITTHSRSSKTCSSRTRITTHSEIKSDNKYRPSSPRIPLPTRRRATHRGTRCRLAASISRTPSEIPKKPKSSIYNMFNLSQTICNLSIIMIKIIITERRIPQIKHTKNFSSRKMIHMRVRMISNNCGQRKCSLRGASSKRSWRTSSS